MLRKEQYPPFYLPVNLWAKQRSLKLASGDYDRKGNATKVSLFVLVIRCSQILCKILSAIQCRNFWCFYSFFNLSLNEIVID